jgi:hypothetical protein
VLGVQSAERWCGVLQPMHGEGREMMLGMRVGMRWCSNLRRRLRLQRVSSGTEILLLPDRWGDGGAVALPRTRAVAVVEVGWSSPGFSPFGVDVWWWPDVS